MSVYLVCPNCKKITEGTENEIGSTTVDIIWCNECRKDFKCASSFAQGGLFKDVFGKDRKYCIPYEIADSFHK